MTPPEPDKRPRYHYEPLSEAMEKEIEARHGKYGIVKLPEPEMTYEKAREIAGPICLNDSHCKTVWKNGRGTGWMEGYEAREKEEEKRFLEEAAAHSETHHKLSAAREALKSISKHQQFVGGSMAQISPTKHIADEALRRIGE